MRARSLWWGVVGCAGMAAFYTIVIASASGWSHLRDQFGQDWYFLVPIVVGFGVQITLMVELRARQHMRFADAAAGGAGAGSSAVGMVACCAHHLAEIAPLVGATAAATFLATYRVAFMVVGIALNVAGITVAGLHLHRFNRFYADHPPAGGDACVTV